MTLNRGLVFAVAMASAHVSSQTAPSVVNFQGRVTRSNGQPITDGTAQIEVNIYDAPFGGTLKWDSGTRSVSVKGGVFSLPLQGDGATTPTLGATTFATGFTWFEIVVWDNNTRRVLSPRQVMAGVPWALWASTVSDGAISSAKLMADAESFSRVTGGGARIQNGTYLFGPGNDLGSVKVQVNGWLRVETAEGSHPAQVQFNDIGNNDAGTVGITDSSGTVMALGGGKGAGWGLAMNTVTGFVGVGTTDPQSRLDVRGPAQISESLHFPLSSVSDNRKIRIGESFIGTRADQPGEEFLTIEPFSHLYMNLKADRTLIFNSPFTNFPNIYVQSGRVGIGDSTYYQMNGNLLSVGGGASKPGGGSWSDISDARLKKNIAPINDALDKLLSLRGRSFEFKEETTGRGRGVHLGFIAQEVDQVFPNWVTAPSGGYKQVTLPFDFSALTVEAIRTLRTENEQLKTLIKGLTVRLEELENKQRRIR